MPPTENSAALFGWHSQDSRATGPLDTADTVTAHYGTGGGNTPLIVQPCICIQGSMIGRAEKNGPQGDGLNQEVCFTLNTVDEHAVAYTFAEQNYSEYVLSPAGGTIKANGGATGGGETLVAHNQPHYIVRRLMPLECSRLQGFPDGWGEIEHLPADMPPDTADFWRGVYRTACTIKGVVPKKSILTSDKALAKWHNQLHTDGAEYKMWGNGMALPNALFFVSRAVAQISADEHRPADTVKLGSLFDGSGTMPLAAVMCGATPVWASEVEPYPIAVTKTHLPNVRHLGNVSAIDGGKIEPVDIFTFGSPCQDLSIAGRRKGLKGQKSSLFWEAIRIASEMLAATGGRYPRFVIWENVYGALSSNGGDDFEIVLNELLHLTGSNEFIRQHGIWGALQGMEKLPTVLSMRNIGECPSVANVSMLSLILVENPPTKYYLTVKAMNGILDRASRRGKPLPDLLTTAIAGMKEWYRQNPPGGGKNLAYTLKIRQGCDGGGKGALIQTELSATLATNNDQTLFAPVTKE